MIVLLLQLICFNETMNNINDSQNIMKKEESKILINFLYFFISKN